MDAIATIATAAGLSWASGIRLYAVLFICGALHALGWVELPQALQPLAHPIVLTVTGLLLALEFATDKVPFVDSVWDAIHTFIRIPAGALLAVGAIGPVDTPVAISAALLGASLAGSSHFAKAGGRLLINTSPEPVSNWAASFGEDALVPATILLAFNYPLVLLAFLLAFVAAVVWLAPRLFRGIHSFTTRLRGSASRGPG